MNDLEKFVHNAEDHLPHLLKIALIHYRFETIHPFLDGNGRVGGLMITLYLVEKGILNKPVICLSDFFERNKMLYYDHLTRIRETSDLTEWLKFFLVGVIETAKNSCQAFDAVLKLQKEVDDKLQSLGSRASVAQKLMHELYQRPVINGNRATKLLDRSAASVYKLISSLEEMNILREVTGGKRKRLYVFKDYVDLFR